MSIENRFGRHMLAASAVAIATAVSANAAVLRWNCNLSIPATSAGLFINIQTQVSAPTTAAVPGWDFNLYTLSPSSASITMYGYTGTQFMQAPGQFGTWPGNIQDGTEVSPASRWLLPGTDYNAVFNAPGQSTIGAWNYNSSNYFGFKFIANDGFTHYGYGRMDVGANANVRTLKWIDWETTANTGIALVPAPGALALLGLAGFGRSRRRS